jgi:hypothetical protein
MNQALRTSGEILFEQYLESQSLPFEFEKKHAVEGFQIDSRAKQRR